MRPAWKYYSHRRGITIEGLIKGGMSTYAELVQYCNQRIVEAPSEDEFSASYQRLHQPPALPEPPVIPEVKKPEPPAKKTPAKKARRKKVGT